MRIHNSSSLPIRALLAVAISVTLFGIVFSSPVNPRADPSCEYPIELAKTTLSTAIDQTRLQQRIKELTANLFLHTQLRQLGLPPSLQPRCPLPLPP